MSGGTVSAILRGLLREKMSKNRRRVAILFLCSIPWGVASAGTERAEDPTLGEAAPRHAVSLYGGVATPAFLIDLMKFLPTSFDPYSLVTVAYGYRVATDQKVVAFELEGQLTTQFEDVGALALQAVALLRILPMPWDRLVNGSAALGMGPSYAFRPSPNERATLPGSPPLLWYMSLEFDFDLVRSGALQLMARIHHRSGMFGVFGLTGGVNYACGGLRYRF